MIGLRLLTAAATTLGERKQRIAPQPRSLPRRRIPKHTRYGLPRHHLPKQPRWSIAATSQNTIGAASHTDTSDCSPARPRHAPSRRPRPPRRPGPGTGGWWRTGRTCRAGWTATPAATIAPGWPAGRRTTRGQRPARACQEVIGDGHQGREREEKHSDVRVGGCGGGNARQCSERPKTEGGRGRRQVTFLAQACPVSGQASRSQARNPRQWKDREKGESRGGAYFFPTSGGTAAVRVQGCTWHRIHTGDCRIASVTSGEKGVCSAHSHCSGGGWRGRKARGGGQCAPRTQGCTHRRNTPETGRVCVYARAREGGGYEKEQCDDKAPKAPRAHTCVKS